MNLSRKRILAAVVLAAFVPLSAITCAESNASSSSAGTGGSGGDVGSSTGGADAGSDAEDEGLIITPDASNDGGLGDGCVSLTAEAEIVPLDMVILLDRSGSMSTSDKWGSAVTAIKGFADTPGVFGMGLGLQYFPPKSGDECLPQTYQVLDVPLALLPGNASPIKISLLNTSPTGQTPMRSALEGVIGYMKSYVTQNPTHEGVVILVTDGDPGGCTSNTVSTVAQVAMDGATVDPKVRTFVVGMTGATFASLDTIAAAGGTTKSFNVGSGTGSSQALIAALDKIRASALACEYILPVPKPSEGQLDTESVEVVFTPGLNDPPVSIQKVTDPSLCGDISGGFYYDDPSAPTRIVLCPASCDLIKGGSQSATVKVVLGCIQPPPQ